MFRNFKNDDQIEKNFEINGKMNSEENITDSVLNQQSQRCSMNENSEQISLKQKDNRLETRGHTNTLLM